MVLILVIGFIFLLFFILIYYQDKKINNIFDKSIKDIDVSYQYILKLLINCKNEEQINTIFNWGTNVLNEKYKFYLKNKNGFIKTIIYNNVAYYTLLLTDKRKEILNNKSYVNNGTGSDLIYYWDY